ncbi:Na(+)/H(+) antiporter subunit C [Antrihabitans sp. YC2-6]|uniref:Na(+)/H(+) antiporter subunit C n=1 Tax=Antrihabitans sp. YC2-6 TaxID=2799498 RepID=UPI0018F56782|nr:Na(+)/H(+) antiporter subunit C [Antrihabitans sp. YC2-6]MBJ8348597.1 Na(+)/H(+) antiporter subunit C [Antrihabitans sp. YC2-6]
MTANLGLLIVIGVLASAGTYLVLERSITKMLLGAVLIGNSINLLILTVGGEDGNPPIVGRTREGAESTPENMADPLAQAMILTAIVITMGLSAFVLALGYRSFTLTTEDRVENDPEDVRVQTRRTRADAPDQDRSDDPITGEPSRSGDAFDSKGNPIPLEALRNRKDLLSTEEAEGDIE